MSNLTVPKKEPFLYSKIVFFDLENHTHLNNI